MKKHIAFAKNFLNNLSNGAGYSVSNAIAELIDNAIDGRATKIEIEIRNKHFSIKDSGLYAGMSETTLNDCFFRGGDSSNANNNEALGRYGIGGKTSIISLIGNIPTDVIIKSHKAGFSPLNVTWPVSSLGCDEYDYWCGQDDNVPFGTTISFNMERELTSKELHEVRCFIAVTYCWRIAKGLEIILNDKMISACDPLYRRNETLIARGLVSTTSVTAFGYPIDICVAQLKSNDSIGGSSNFGVFDATPRKGGVTAACRSGLFIKTADRYLTLGNNYDNIIGGTNHASIDGLRIEVNIPKELWDKCGIAWNKGKDITPFKEINGFEKLVSVINNIRAKYINGKQSVDEKKCRKRTEEINQTLQYTEVEIVPNGNIKTWRIDYNGKKLIIQRNMSDKSGDNEFMGFIKGTAQLIDRLVGLGEQDLVYVLVEDMNEKLPVAA